MSIRERISTLLNDIQDETLKELIDGSLDAEKLKWAYCKKCHSKVQVDYPDLDKRTKMLAALMDQSFGKPAETKKVEGTVTLKAVSEMSDAELAILAELKELPPAA